MFTLDNSYVRKRQEKRTFALDDLYGDHSSVNKKKNFSGWRHALIFLYLFILFFVLLPFFSGWRHVSPFSISPSFILFFVLLPFFSGWRHALVFLYLSLFHSLFRLTSFFSSWRHALVFHYLSLFHSLPRLTSFLSQHQDRRDTKLTFEHSQPADFALLDKYCVVISTKQFHESRNNPTK